MGSAASVQWLVGRGGKGNDGVAGAVKSTPRALGYVELTHALTNKINFGSVQNLSGQFVKASIGGVQEAASVVLPTSGIASITSATGAASYRISTYSYAIFYQDQKDGNRSAAQASALRAMLTWVVTKGQACNGAPYYAPLPTAAQTRARHHPDHDLRRRGRQVKASGTARPTVSRAVLILAKVLPDASLIKV